MHITLTAGFDFTPERPSENYLTRILADVREWEAECRLMDDEDQQDQTFEAVLQFFDGREASVTYRWNPGYQRGIPGDLEWSSQSRN